MPKYIVTAKEVLDHYMELEASSETDAIAKSVDMYGSETVVDASYSVKSVYVELSRREETADETS